MHSVYALPKAIDQELQQPHASALKSSKMPKNIRLHVDSHIDFHIDCYIDFASGTAFLY